MNQSELAWAKKTAHLKGFASPWDRSKEGFRSFAYPTATNFADALEGFKGKRKQVMFHMTNSGEAGEIECSRCGVKLNQPAEGMGDKVDKNSTWFFVPKQGIGGGQHYACSWSSIFDRVLKIQIALR